MLSGLFKRKDRKGSRQDDDVDDGEKTSEEYTRASPQPKDSSESLPLEAPGTKQASQRRPQRQTRNLQKAPPPGIASGVKSPPNGRREVVSPKPTSVERSQPSMAIPLTKGAPPSVGQIKIPRAFEEPSSNQNEDLVQNRDLTSEEEASEHMQIESPKESRRGMFSPIKDALLSSSPATSELKPEKVKRAKHRMLIDDFDSDSSPDTENRRDPILERPDRILEQEQRNSHEIPREVVKERLSESPIQVSGQESSYSSPDLHTQPQSRDKSITPQEYSYGERMPQERPSPMQQSPYTPQPMHYQSSTSHDTSLEHHSPMRPPGLVVDTSSQEEPSVSPVSPISSPELIDPPTEESHREETPASTAQSSSTLPAWNDASLRAYLENDNEIRDLLLVVHDKSSIQPAPPDHPVAKKLFREESQKLGAMSNQLDAMLGNLLERRSKTRRR